MMNPMERKILTQDVWPLKDGICSRVTTAEASKIREMVQSRGLVFRIDQELVVMLTSDLEKALNIDKKIDLTRPPRYPDFIKLNPLLIEIPFILMDDFLILCPELTTSN